MRADSVGRGLGGRRTRSGSLRGNRGKARSRRIAAFERPKPEIGVPGLRTVGVTGPVRVARTLSALGRGRVCEAAPRAQSGSRAASANDRFRTLAQLRDAPAGSRGIGVAERVCGINVSPAPFADGVCIARQSMRARRGFLVPSPRRDPSASRAGASAPAASAAEATTAGFSAAPRRSGRLGGV